MWNTLYLMFKTYFLYHQNAHFILEGVVTTFQVYIIIVFFMTTMVNMLAKSENFKKSKNNKKICNHMPSQLISFYLLISLEGMSTLIRSQGHQIDLFCCSVSVLDFALAFSLFLSSRALLSSALSKRFFCNLILFV